MNDSLVRHLLELRKRLLFILAGFGLVLVSLLPWNNQIYQQLAAPLAKFMAGHAQLIATDITSPFLVPLKLTALVAFMLSLPHSLFQVWQFLAPGLYRHEKKLLAWVISSSLLLFAAGLAFCYFLVLPTIFHFIVGIKAPQIAMLTDIDKYLSFVLSLFIIFGCAFEMPVIIFLLIHFGILPLAQARKWRKYMFVTCFIIAAIVTPPDVLSQTLLALPLYALYELGMLAAGCLGPLRQPSDLAKEVE